MSPPIPDYRVGDGYDFGEGVESAARRMGKYSFSLSFSTEGARKAVKERK